MTIGEIYKAFAPQLVNYLVARDDEADFLRRLNALLARLPPLLREAFALYRLSGAEDAGVRLNGQSRSER